MTDVRSLKEIAEGKNPDLSLKDVERTRRITRRRFLPKLLKLAGHIPFSDDLAAAWFCAQDSETPLRVKGVLLAALAYFIIPTDMVPDVIAMLGFTDDATVLATALGVVGGHIQGKHRREAQRLLRKTGPETADHSGATTNSR